MKISFSPMPSPLVSRKVKRTKVPGRIVRVTPGATVSTPSTSTSPFQTVSFQRVCSPL